MMNVSKYPRLFSFLFVVIISSVTDTITAQIQTVRGRIVVEGEDVKGKKVEEYPQNVMVFSFSTKEAAKDFTKQNKKLEKGEGTFVETDEKGFYEAEVIAGSYLVCYHPETREDPQMKAVPSNGADVNFVFKADGIVLKQVDVKAKKRKGSGVKEGRTRVFGDSITFDVNFYLEDGLGGSNKRLIVQPYAISCENDLDTVACLSPILLEGLEYHIIQDKRKDYDYEHKDPLHKYYSKEDTLTTDSVRVRKTIAFKRPHPEKYYYCTGRILLADYTHIIWTNEGDTTVFGSCYPIEPLKFLEFNLANTEMPLDRNRFYEKPDSKVKDVNQNLQLLFVVGRAEFTTDSINIITTRQLADELQSYGDGLVKVDIMGTSSPDGGFELNNNLASKRAARAWTEVSKYVRGNHFQRTTISKVYTWIDVADSLAAKGYTAEAATLRDVATQSGEYSRAAQVAARNMAIYDSIVEPILVSQRAMACTYYYKETSPFTPEEAADAWLHDPDFREGGPKRFTNGDYFNILTVLKDSTEQRKVVERAYREITRRRGYQHYPFPAYIANRMAVYRLQDGVVDTTILKPFIDFDAAGSDIEKQISLNNMNRWTVNRREILANQALMYLRSNKLNYSEHLIEKLPFGTPIKTEIRKYFDMITLIMHWDDPTLTENERQAGMDAMDAIMEESKINAAVLKSELSKELELDKIEVLNKYVDSLPDNNPKKWYLKGMLLASSAGNEDLVLAKANDNIISILEAFDKGLRAESLTDETFPLYRALTEQESLDLDMKYTMPPLCYPYDSLIAKFDSLATIANEVKKSNTTPYFLAYFQHSFDMMPEYAKFFHRDGNIEKAIRMKHPYRKKDIAKYKEKFEMLEPKVAKAFKDARSKTTQKPAATAGVIPVSLIDAFKEDK